MKQGRQGAVQYALDATWVFFTPNHDFGLGRGRVARSRIEAGE